MAKFAVVVKDPAVARDKEIERNLVHNLVQAAKGKAIPSEAHVRALRKRLEAMVTEKQAGDLHTHIDEACPLGLPNCRNCGDPQFAEACQAAGHCPDCGTRHGIAPDRIVAANGFELVEMADPKPGEQWDRQARRFK